MQLIIKSNSEEYEDFIKYYLPGYIYRLFLNTYDRRKLNELDNSYNIKSFNLITFCLKNLMVTKSGINEYTIKPNNSLKYNYKKLQSYINMITYGTINTKGYPILLDIFNYVSDNINKIYGEYNNGNTIL